MDVKKLIKQESIEGSLFHYNRNLIDKVIKLEGMYHEWEYLNFHCYALRHPELNHWCGYVGVTPTNKLYRKHYDDIVFDKSIDLDNLPYDPDKQGVLNLFCDLANDDGMVRVYHILDTHRGITWANKYQLPFGKIGRWYFGFDCAHSGDVTFPNLTGMTDYEKKRIQDILLRPSYHNEYRTLTYVKRLTNEMADQLIYFNNEKCIHKTRGKRFRKVDTGRRNKDN